MAEPPTYEKAYRIFSYSFRGNYSFLNNTYFNILLGGLSFYVGAKGTLVSRIEVPVRLFFFAFFPQPVCLIWVYVFISFFLK